MDNMDNDDIFQETLRNFFYEEKTLNKYEFAYYQTEKFKIFETFYKLLREADEAEVITKELKSLLFEMAEIYFTYSVNSLSYKEYDDFEMFIKSLNYIESYYVFNSVEARSFVAYSRYIFEKFYESTFQTHLDYEQWVFEIQKEKIAEVYPSCSTILDPFYKAFFDQLDPLSSISPPDLVQVLPALIAYPGSLKYNQGSLELEFQDWALTSLYRVTAENYDPNLDIVFVDKEGNSYQAIPNYSLSFLQELKVFRENIDKLENRQDKNQLKCLSLAQKDHLYQMSIQSLMHIEKGFKNEDSL